MVRLPAHIPWSQWFLIVVSCIVVQGCILPILVSRTQPRIWNAGGISPPGHCHWIESRAAAVTHFHVHDYVDCSLGLINFGMINSSNSGSLGRSIVIIVGLFTLANAVFNFYVICSHPAFRTRNVDGSVVLSEEVCDARGQPSYGCCLN